MQEVQHFPTGLLSNNFYNHYLLLKLKGNGGDQKDIRLPKVVYLGLSHYLFEIIVFIGVSFISQTLYALCFIIGTIFYFDGKELCHQEMVHFQV